MANEGFKGNEMGIAAISITGANVQVEVHFSDADGMVHAIAKHSIPIGENQPIADAAEALLKALVQHVSKLHFTSPDNNPNTPEAIGGIAEALRSGDAGSDISDGFEAGD